MKKIAVLLFVLAGVLLADRNGDPTPPSPDGQQPGGVDTWYSGTQQPFQNYGNTIQCGAYPLTGCASIPASPYTGMEVKCVNSGSYIYVQYSINPSYLTTQTDGACNNMTIQMNAGEDIYWLHTKGTVKNSSTGNLIRNWYYWTSCDLSGYEQSYYDTYTLTNC